MIIYQYRGRLNEAGFEYLEALLLRGEIMFSRPSDFNDPFDVYPNQFHEVPEHEIPSFRNATYDTINAAVQAVLSVDIGVACFTPRPDNHLMWSHYGDRHRGVCVGFRREVLSDNAPTRSGGEPLYHGPTKVNYTDRRSVSTQEVIHWKSDIWSYEEEERLVTDSLRDGEGGPGVGTVPNEAIAEIVLGARVSKGNVDKVCELLSAHRPDVVLKCIVPEPQTYGLAVELLSDQPIGTRWRN